MSSFRIFAVAFVISFVDFSEAVSQCDEETQVCAQNSPKPDGVKSGHAALQSKVTRHVSTEVAEKIASRKGKPNMLFILADDLGYNDVGFNGDPGYTTPHIDSIATQGVKFTRGYVSFCTCGPSRAGILTGRDAQRFGFNVNPSENPDPAVSQYAGLPMEEETIGDILQRGGYSTAMIGKWHMGHHEKYHPNKRGFDYFFGFLFGGAIYFPTWKYRDVSEIPDHQASYNVQMMENEKILENEVFDAKGYKPHQRWYKKTYITDILVDYTLKWLDEKAKEPEKPWFIYASFNAPHTPLQAPKPLINSDEFKGIKDKYRQQYAAMMRAFDDAVKLLLDKLEDLKMIDNTIVTFLSDNGGSIQEAKGTPNKKGSNNFPLRHGKSSLYEGGIRVPMAMMWKGVIPAGTVYEKGMVTSLDFIATIASLSGAEISKDRPLDGVNIIPYVTDDNDLKPREYTYVINQAYRGMVVIKDNGMKFVNNKGRVMDAESEPFGTRAGDELFNLNDDIGETKNLIGKPEYKDLIKELQDRYVAYFANMKPTRMPSNMNDKWDKPGYEGCTAVACLEGGGGESEAEAEEESEDFYDV